MKKLNAAALMRGDIVLTTSNAKISGAIRTATGSDISHAMIYVQAYSVVDATAEGVQARNTQRLPFEDNCAVYALRLKGGLSDEQTKKICDFARSKVATQYSITEAVRVELGGKKPASQKQFCSRLVAQAYAHAGIALVQNPDFCSPAELKASSLLEKIENPTVKMPPKEVAFLKQRLDTTKKMRDATNELFKGIRTKNQAVQNFEDLIEHIMAHPEDDNFVADLLATSGYLDVWRVEVDKNPWHYDLDEMCALRVDDAKLVAYCQEVLNEEAVGPNRYVRNRGQYAWLAAAHSRRTFSVLKELYSFLAALHARRVDVARRWLQLHGYGQPSKDKVLIPHSPEWFAMLEMWDPAQAAMTRAVVSSTGSSDVCSICGDEPGRDYHLVPVQRNPYSPNTLRLCDDCVNIRRGSGEELEEL